MSKTLYKLFPVIDHLYIYQNFEYNSLDFLRWFLKNPFKRNLQKKHKIVWTNKAFLIFIVSLFLILLDTNLTSFYFTNNFLLTFLLIPIKLLYTPIFLIIANFLILPLEYFQKQKILNKTSEKLNKLPNLKIVAITGSFGKTSTKDILHTLLFKKYFVVKTPKSFNTPLGISQTILRDIKNNTNIFICEVGAYKKGEIENIAKIIKPDIGIITAIAPQHLEKFGSLENIALAKFELVKNLKNNGIAILNGEYKKLEDLSSQLTNTKTIFYGTEKNQYFATNIKTEINGILFTLHTPKGTENIVIPLIGEHHVQNFLAASVAAINLGLTLSEIKQRAKLLLPTPHRMEIQKIGNITLIDNSYNTNPKSAESSLNLLASFESRKIVITPGFVQLGKQSQEANRGFGKNIACVADEVIIVGKNAKKDLLEGIKEVWPDEHYTHFVNSTQEGLILAQQLAKNYIQQVARNDTEVVVLLENDLPDQYS